MQENNQNKIIQILKGVDKEAINKLEDLENQLGENYSSCWYPSSSSDFGIIYEIELSGWKPDLFLYTDYGLASSDPIEEGRVYKHKYTQSKIESVTELKITVDVNYHVNESHVQNTELISTKPIVLLLKISLWHIDSKKSLGEKNVIFFNFENINFLDEILLRQSVKVDYFLKTNEGISWGGGGERSIKGVYGLFSELGISYFLSDKTGDKGDSELFTEMIEKHKLSPKDYKLKGLPVRAKTDRGTCYCVEYNEDFFAVDKLKWLFDKY